MPDTDLDEDLEPNPNSALPWEELRKYKRIFRLQASRSYLYLAFGIGLLAALFPILLILAAGYEEHKTISYFYHSKNPLGRDVMVGTLCGVGVFLFLFQGLSKLENWLLNLGGAASIAVALIPMPPDQCHTEPYTIHGSAAFVFFGCLAVVAVFLSKGRLKHIVWPPLKRRLWWAYTLSGGAMIVLPVIAFLINKAAPTACEHHGVFWAEALGIWAFSAYWFFKAYEYRKLLDIR